MENIEIIAMMEIPGAGFNIYEGHPDILPVQSIAHLETHNEFRAVFFDVRRFEGEMRVNIERSMHYQMVLN